MQTWAEMTKLYSGCDEGYDGDALSDAHATQELPRVPSRSVGGGPPLAKRVLVPIGAGAHFSVEWQRHFDLELERKRVLGKGVRIENDTLFAFQFDTKREKEDEAQLAELRVAMGSLGDSLVSTPPGLRDVPHPAPNPRLEPQSREWDPCARGTRAHARLVQLASQPWVRS